MDVIVTIEVIMAGTFLRKRAEFIKLTNLDQTKLDALMTPLFGYSFHESSYHDVTFRPQLS